MSDISSLLAGTWYTQDRKFRIWFGEGWYRIGDEIAREMRSKVLQPNTLDFDEYRISELVGDQMRLHRFTPGMIRLLIHAEVFFLTREK